MWVVPGLRTTVPPSPPDSIWPAKLSMSDTCPLSPPDIRNEPLREPSRVPEGMLLRLMVSAGSDAASVL